MGPLKTGYCFVCGRFLPLDKFTLVDGRMECPYHYVADKDRALRLIASTHIQHEGRHE